MPFRRFTSSAFVKFAALVLLLAAVGVSAQAQSAQVSEIVITGNQNISDDAIRAVVSNLTPGGEFSAEAMEADRRAIAELGYFSSTTARSEETPAGLRVNFDVVEFPLITEIRFVGNRSISTERLLSILRSRPGQVYNEQTLSLDIDAVQREYTSQGYFAFVSEDVGIDPQTGVLTIPILESIVESVDIVGNRKTDDEVFLREMRTRPGTPLNRNILDEDVRKIYSLGILDPSAYQRPNIEPGRETGSVIVVIPVTEMKTGQVSVGLGYSSRKKLVGRAELTEANFRGRGQRVNLLLEIGQRPSGTSTGGNSYQLSFYEPWLDAKNTSMNVSVYNKLVYRFASSVPLSGSTQIDSQTYSERRKGGTLGFGRPLNPVTRLSATIRAEEVDIALPETLAAGSFLARISQPGPIRSLTFGGTRNTRDFDADPATGWYQSASLELGTAEKNLFEKVGDVWTEVPGESGAFRKIQFDVRRYLSKGGAKVTPEDKRRTLALRLTGGIASGTLLFSEQFFVGGAETLRGYREDRFWGDRMLLLSTEYRIPIGKSLTGVIFADYGDAWRPVDGIQPDPDVDTNASLFTQHSSFDPQLGVGVGIRVVTPIGPLRLDYGVGSDGARTHFSIGHAF